MYRYFITCLGIVGFVSALVTKGYSEAALWFIIVIQDFEIRKLEDDRR